MIMSSSTVLQKYLDCQERLSFLFKAKNKDCLLNLEETKKSIAAHCHLLTKLNSKNVLFLNITPLSKILGTCRVLVHLINLVLYVQRHPVYNLVVLFSIFKLQVYFIVNSWEGNLRDVRNPQRNLISWNPLLFGFGFRLLKTCI